MRFFPRSLNIRSKVLAALLACLGAVGFLAALSISRLSEIEDKLELVEIANDLSDTILEARRYEKNYLLYSQRADLDEAVSFTEKAENLRKIIATKSKSPSALKMVHDLREAVGSYLGSLEDLRATEGRKHLSQDFEERMRGQGKDLVERTLGLARYERSLIEKITETLQAQLVIAVIAFVIMAIALMILVRSKIIRPLAAIEEATRRIARGEFSTLDAPRGADETGRVLNAFDTMVRELEMRQDQLVQSKKLSSIGTLAAGIAHQLNNPLNNISTSCQIAIEEFESGDREFLMKMLGNIDKETLRARDIVRGLLEFSREKVFALYPTPVAELLRASVRLASGQIPSGIEVKVEAPADLTALMDKQKMQEVFINLIINAVQAIKEKQGSISIEAKNVKNNQMSPPECVEISVADSGEGIPESLQAQIFDPFFTTKEVGEGTGLGLSIVYGIIKKHGGSIEVQSAPGKGARFIIRLSSITGQIKV